MSSSSGEIFQSREEATRTTADRGGPALELRGIKKSFGGVRALRGANLSVRRGEIMGLCGENGAGKSTLLKILAGVYPFGSYSGDVIVEGQVRQLAGPPDARRAGIAVVHQELMLVPELTVAQNLLLGREPRRFGLVDDARLESMARAELERFGFADRIDVTKLVGELGIGLQQIVEIVRALALDARILVLDEPTAALTGNEVEALMSWLRSLRAKGTTAVYVSHRLDEIFELCDRVTVLRDGVTVATLEVAEITPDRVVSEMVGRSVEEARRADHDDEGLGEAILAVQGLSVFRKRAKRHDGEGDGRERAVNDVSFSLRRGEILAVCGAMGAGRTALLSALFGCARAGVSGRVTIDGVPLRLDSPEHAIRQGLAFVPEDRKGRGLVLGMSVAENLALPTLATSDDQPRFGLVDSEGEALMADRRIRSLHIRGEAKVAVSTLSGGNQQKVVLGKWLEQPPRVLLLDEPTRGIDVGAREEIYGILEDLARRGVAILIASSDLAEVLRLARRVIVLRSGCIVGELDGSTASETDIVELSTGAGAAGPSMARADTGSAT